MLRSDLCNYIHAYTVVKGTVTVTDPNNDAYHKELAFKNNAAFIKFISKINNVLTDIAGDLCIVMPMYKDWKQQKLLKNSRKFIKLLKR